MINSWGKLSKNNKIKFPYLSRTPSSSLLHNSRQRRFTLCVGFFAISAACVIPSSAILYINQQLLLCGSCRPSAKYRLGYWHLSGIYWTPNLSFVLLLLQLLLTDGDGALGLLFVLLLSILDHDPFTICIIEKLCPAAAASSSEPTSDHYPLCDVIF